MRRLLAVILSVLGCQRTQLADPGVDPPDRPADASMACADVCGDSPGRPAADDPVAFLGRGTDNFRGFFEPVEVVRWKDRIALCTGVRGVAVYRNDDPCCMSLEAAVRPDPRIQFPRCQHLAFRDDWAIVANRGDELSPESFVTVIDMQEPLLARRLSVLSDGETSYEGVAVLNDTVYVAQHERGLGVVALSDAGVLTPVTTVSDSLQNAWKPYIDGDRLYVADAQAGLVVFDIRDPRRPVFMGRAPTEGTLKALAIDGRYVYGASGSAGVEVFDVMDPLRPERVRRLDTQGSALGVSVDGDHLVVADWNDIVVYRRSDPASPTRLGHQKAYTAGRPDPLGRILDVTMHDGVVYMAEWTNVQAHRVVPDAQAPDLRVDAVVELPRAPVGETSDTGLAIRNLGEQPLIITRTETSGPFSVEVFGAEVAPGGQALATLTFTPESDAAAEGSLTISSNDPDEPTVVVELQGNLPGLRTGDAVPDLTFTSLDGRRTLSLSSLRGQPVLLAYFATF